MTESEYFENTESNNGWCVHCKEVTAIGGIEPDARKYRCEKCSNQAVYGIEEALMMGEIEIEDEEDGQ